jgi:hypothetical protein
VEQLVPQGAGAGGRRTVRRQFVGHPTRQFRNVTLELGYDTEQKSTGPMLRFVKGRQVVPHKLPPVSAYPPMAKKPLVAPEGSHRDGQARVPGRFTTGRSSRIDLETRPGDPESKIGVHGKRRTFYDLLDPIPEPP